MRIVFESNETLDSAGEFIGFARDGVGGGALELMANGTLTISSTATPGVTILTGRTTLKSGMRGRIP